MLVVKASDAFTIHRINTTTKSHLSQNVCPKMSVMLESRNSDLGGDSLEYWFVEVRDLLFLESLEQSLEHGRCLLFLK